MFSAVTPPRPSSPTNLSTSLNQTAPLHGQSYDHQGALTYVVAVCCVYALAIFFMIASHVRRRQDKREQDQEINVFLRSQPAIREAEERQRRRNLKRAMKPFIDLMINKRTIGVQADNDLMGNFSGSQTFIAMYGVPGTPAFSEEMEATDIVVAGNHHHHHRRHSHVMNPFRKQTVSHELSPSLLLKENDKSVQCSLKTTVQSSTTQSRLATPSLQVPSSNNPNSRRSSNPSYQLDAADSDLICDFASPIILQFDGDSQHGSNYGNHGNNRFPYSRSVTPRVDTPLTDDGNLKPPSGNVVIRIDREELLWTPSPRPHRKTSYTSMPLEEKISSV